MISVLMWKNLKVQKRQICQLIFEIILPLIFPALFSILRERVTPNKTERAIHEWRTFRFKVFPNMYKDIEKFEIAYYPNSSECLPEIMKYASETIMFDPEVFGKPFHPIFRGYNNASDLKKERNFIFGVIQFDKSFIKKRGCPNNINFKMRYPNPFRFNGVYVCPSNTWRTDYLAPHLKSVRYRELPVLCDEDRHPHYIREAMLSVHYAVARAFIQYFNCRNENIKLPWMSIGKFPTSEFEIDTLLEFADSHLTIILAISYFYPCFQSVKFLTTEKEKGLKAVMTVMGVSDSLHLIAMFIRTSIIMLIITIAIAVVLKFNWTGNANYSVIKHTEMPVFLIFLFLYSLTLLSFSLMISAFFSEVVLAVPLTGLLLFISYLPYFITKNHFKTFQIYETIILSFFPNTALGYGIYIIIELEDAKEGLNFGNLFKSVPEDSHNSFGIILIAMSVSCLVYFLIALYVTKLYPGEYGHPEPWNFLFTKRYWISDNRSKLHKRIRRIPFVENFEHAERQSAGAPKANCKPMSMTALKLRKCFDDNIVVNTISMELYPDQITILLGRNGAGKTTTILMLAGMIIPTDGSVIINNNGVRKHIKRCDGELGLCPKKDILFDDLTVREHIEFFCRLKKLSRNQITLEVKKYIDLLHFENDINKKVKILSFGTRRKLSVALAFCGGSKIVLCDQPTSGMDPASRRLVWNLFSSERKNRAILLTTHFMDEASVLSDRILIMCNGVLIANGEAACLKEKYKLGSYKFIILKNKNCDPYKVSSFLCRLISDLRITTNTESLLIYECSEKHFPQFIEILQSLEKASSDLNIHGCRVLSTTLDDVLTSVCSSKEELPIDLNNKSICNKGIVTNNMGVLKIDENPINNRSYKSLVAGKQLRLNQFISIFYKNYLYAIRNYIFILQVALPVIYFLLTVLMFNLIDNFKEPLEHKFNMEQYRQGIIVQEKPKMANKIFVRGLRNTLKYHFHSLNFTYREISFPFTTYMFQLANKINYIDILKTHRLCFSDAGEMQRIYFNQHYYHSAPDAVNEILNGWLRLVSGNESSKLIVSNYPLPFAKDKTQYRTFKAREFNFHLILNISLCMSFLSAFFIVFQIKERVSNFKLMLYETGIPVILFWIAQFLFDALTFLLIGILIVMMIWIFQIEGFQTIVDLLKTLDVIFFLGMTSIPTAYLFAFFTNDYASGLVSLIMFNIYTGFVPFYFVVLAEDNLRESFMMILKSVMRMFPHYVFAMLFRRIPKQMPLRLKSKCLKDCGNSLKQWPDTLNICSYKGKVRKMKPLAGIAGGMIFILFIVKFVVLLAKEYKFLDKLRHRGKKIKQKYSKKQAEEKSKIVPSKSVGVESERLKISKLTTKQKMKYNLILNEVTQLRSKKFALNQISFSVPPKKCFGLLGECGAGKTFICNIIIQEKRFGGGDIYIKGKPRKKMCTQPVLQSGYCPQYSALPENLTGREILHIFALLRGVEIRCVREISQNVINEAGFENIIDKPIYKLTAGNVRILSTFIALTSEKLIILLDNAAAGIDHNGKELLLNKTYENMESGRSIVMVPSYMEECEILCKYSAIMFNGEFKYFGLTKEFMKAFAKDLILKVIIPKELNVKDEKKPVYYGHIRSENSVIDYIKRNFENVIVTEQYANLVKFHIPKACDKWLQLFSMIEEKKIALHINDYSISQPTLEDVFIGFSKLNYIEQTKLLAMEKTKHNKSSKKH